MPAFHWLKIRLNRKQIGVPFILSKTEQIIFFCFLLYSPEILETLNGNFKFQACISRLSWQKTNSFIRFLEEPMARQSAFGSIWPLGKYKGQKNFEVNCLVFLLSKKLAKNDECSFDVHKFQSGSLKTCTFFFLWIIL